MSRGFLISFEGGDGCGKSTQIKKMTYYLAQKGIDFVLTHEPGGTAFGEKIRNILLNDKVELSPLTEFLLFSSTRSKLIAEVIEPALAEGKVVVMDRYFDSSFAYQGFAGGLDVETLKDVTDFATGELKPDLTFLLDLSYEEGMRRKSQDEKLKNLDRIESKGKSYHDRVRAGYLELAKKDANRIFVVNAVDTVENIHNKIIAEFERRYNKNKTP